MKVGMVSIYPPPESKHAKLGGVASYTKNLVVSLLNNCRVTVFADRMSHANDEYHEGAMVYRCWSKGVLYPFQIFKKLLNNEIDVVHVQHEIYLYGGLGSAIVFPLLLFFIRLLRKPLVVTLHGVIPLSNVDGRFLKENGIRGKPFLMKVGLTLLVKMVAFLSTSIVVHEEKFKEVLRSEYGCSPRKVWVIHHGIEERNDLIRRDEAKRRLGLSGKNVILFFGYITGYKNVELLIESANFLKFPNWVMVIAGGPHPRLRSDPNYHRYLSFLQEKAFAVSQDQILFSGFIPEEEIFVYFSAVDLVVFTHNIHMAASGPLALTISYEKPFLISDCFQGTIQKDVAFRNNPAELASKINKFFGDTNFQLRVLKVSKDLKKKHLWKNISLQTCELYQKMMEKK